MSSKWEDIRSRLQEEMKSLDRRRSRATRVLAVIEQRMKALSVASDALSKNLDGQVGNELPIEEISAYVKKFEMTSNIRAILDSSTEVLWAPQIRDELMSRGWKPVGPNPLAAIHTVLKRLAHNSDAFMDPNYMGKKGFYGKIVREKRNAEQQAQATRNARFAASEAARASLRPTLPKACYEILRSNPNGMTAGEIVEKLSGSGLDLAYVAHQRFKDDVWAALSLLRSARGRRKVVATPGVKGKTRTVYKAVGD